jgi:ABC-type lipoprotein export system ATPase subunit
MLDPRSVAGALGITNRLDHLPAALSGGEQQRAAIAQVLCAGVRVVVADEPTAQLDDAASRSVLDAITALRDRGVTFVLATHDDSVLERADEVLRLDHGVLSATGGDVDLTPTPGRELPWLGDGPPALELRGVDKTFRLVS